MAPVPDTRKFVEDVEVLRNERVAPDVFLLELRAPKMASVIRPGQFVHLLIDNNLTLRRPLSISRSAGESLYIMYAVVGEGTRLLARKPVGDTSMNVVGPCGNSWPLPAEGTRSLLVGGGLGAAPLGMLAHDLMARGRDFHFIQGARNAELLIGDAQHAHLKRPLEFATDDGSRGHHGLITEPLERALASEHYDVVYICGPEIMQKFCVEVCKKHNVEAYVSLERLMACGIGACLSCNITTKNGPRKVCVDGPIFSANDLEFDDLARSSFH